MDYLHVFTHTLLQREEEPGFEGITLKSPGLYSKPSTNATILAAHCSKYFSQPFTSVQIGRSLFHIRLSGMNIHTALSFCFSKLKHVQNTSNLYK